jgi:RNA polymerase-binding transcription factor DksA
MLRPADGSDMNQGSRLSGAAPPPSLTVGMPFARLLRTASGLSESTIMNKQQREEYRQRLLSLANRLKGDVSGLRQSALRGTGGDASGSLSNAPLHLADLATDTFEQEMALGLLQNGQQTLGAIAAALDRLDAGTYGRCESCGKEIPAERLRAVPFASRCVPCEQKEEAASSE